MEAFPAKAHRDKDTPSGGELHTGFPALWDSMSLPGNLNKQVDTKGKSSMHVEHCFCLPRDERRRTEDRSL